MVRYYCLYCGYNTPRHYTFKRHYKRKTRCVEILWKNKPNPSRILNDFGKETIQHISEVFFTRCINNYAKGFRDLFTKIHFDNPMNNNIRISTIDSDCIEILKDGQWISFHAKDVFADLISRYRSVLLNFYVNNDNIQRTDHHREKYEYISSIEYNKEECEIIEKLLSYVMKQSIQSPQ